jgi:succinate-semialdehyde dehydrogenase/glutarate-semialdehyde dehydrogenase
MMTILSSIGAALGRNFVDGSWVESGTGARRDVISPIDGRSIGSVPWATREDAHTAILAARAAAGGWRRTPVWERAAFCRRIADNIRRRQDTLADVLVTEQGKPVAEARFEVGKAADGFSLAADLVRFLEGRTIPTQDPRKFVFTVYQPRGVYAVITPWNFPINIPVEYLAPGIAAGNVIVWNPAPTTALCAVGLMEAIADADLPPGVVNLVIGAGPEVGDEIVVSRGTDAIGFTGSAATGKTIAMRGAGKPLLLEMGGNGPVVIFADADLDAATNATASGCFVNAGQVCSSSERILVERSVLDGFGERMVAKARNVVLGDPRIAGTTMGPLNNAAVAKKVREHVEDAIDRGARTLIGGGPAGGLGSDLYFQPTVLSGVSRDSLINREETFGPVAPLMSFEGEAEAIELARENRYGLVSSVFTRDLDRAFRMIEAIPTGIVNVNDTSNYWELHIPFGGMAGKDSGIGRLGGSDTLLAMSDVKTATITRG